MPSTEATITTRSIQVLALYAANIPKGTPVPTASDRDRTVSDMVGCTRAQIRLVTLAIGE